MRKLLLLLVLLLSALTYSFAQTSGSKDGGRFNIGFEAGLPLGDAGNAYNSVFGASLKYEQPVAMQTYVTISAGYEAFLTKSLYKTFGAKSAYGFIPLKAGIKYYAQNGLFVEGQVGVVFSTESGGGSAFAFSPGMGYTFDGGFEAGFRYEGWPKGGTTVGQIALRLAYRFQ